MADGGVVIYWRPGCPFCERLDAKLGELGNHATWVNIWEDPQAEEHVKSLNNGDQAAGDGTAAGHPGAAGRGHAAELCGHLPADRH